MAIITAIAKPTRVVILARPRMKCCSKPKWRSIRWLMRSKALRSVAALPARAAVRGGDEDAPVVLLELDAHDAPVRARVHRAGLVAFVLALAIKPIGRGRAAVLEAVAIGLEALEGQIALFPTHWANAVHRALFGVHDGVGPLGTE